MNRWMLLGTLLLSLTRFSWADECVECAPLSEKMAKTLTRRGEQKILLDKNRQYLASLPSAATSKRIKVNSNIFWTAKNLEDLENSIQELDQEIQQRKCDQCK